MLATAFKVLAKSAILLPVVLGLASCQGPGGGFLREGAGLTLFSEGLQQATDLQDVYVDHICRQAGFTRPVDGAGCAPVGARDWEVFVQAGLNDIDQRCDAYLSWLDDKRRSAAPILQQLSDLRTATTAIMAVTGVGVDPIAIAGAAFGLASNTFTNIQSRLVLEVNHSTVQTIVLSGQQRLRAQILRTKIDNRPAAIHVLRQYLRVCMPFTIETEINTTITAFERGGVDAVAFRLPLAGVGPQLVTDVRAPLPRGPKIDRSGPGRDGTSAAGIPPGTMRAYRDFTCNIADDSDGRKTVAALLAYLRTTDQKSPKSRGLTFEDGISLRADMRAGKKAC